MRLPGIAEINGEKLYWGKSCGTWFVADLPEAHIGFCLTTNAERYGLQESIKLFLKQMPWETRVIEYSRSIKIAEGKGWFEVAEKINNILNENYNIH